MLLVVVAVVIVSFCLPLSLSAQISQTFTSDGTFTVPAGVTENIVQAWGGGGDAYANGTLTVVSGNDYIVAVGAVAMLISFWVKQRMSKFKNGLLLNFAFGYFLSLYSLLIKIYRYLLLIMFPPFINSNTFTKPYLNQNISSTFTTSFNMWNKFVFFLSPNAFHLNMQEK
jgi:hypothetical protein